MTDHKARTLPDTEPQPFIRDPLWGYVEAFHEMADLLGVFSPQTGSPKHVYENEVLPKLKELVALRASGKVVAWAEKDGDAWIVYDTDSDTGRHIRDYQKVAHFKSVFPIYARPPAAATPVGIVGERGDVSWRSDQILPVGTKLYAAATQPEQVREVDLGEVIREKVREHGSYRAASKAIGVNYPYLCQMAHDPNRMPSKEILAALGLERVTITRRIEKRAALREPRA